ncbi:Ig-like domain-containing protein [Longimicrobium sp.]|uniref:Ig-like domain-containing protein n=1 Tax=Longimicrobium sp. TaxID=2029185 RepID=UPI002C1F08ED|nr:Ig-like domain-containing protein [Longimicrobium sp.]HSU14293.1 Ig-like domain-containing protein [Longimicrobium sp.]
MRYPQYLAAAPLAFLAACGGGGAATTTAPEPPASTFASLALTPTSGTVEVGRTFVLTPQARDGIGNEMAGAPAPAYTSSDPARATVAADGVVTGVAAGTVTITAVLAWGGVTDTATATLTVTPPAAPPTTFTLLALTPDAGTVAAGATLQLQATPKDQAGTALTGLPGASFSTSDATKATVSASGVVTGVSAGTATISAWLTWGGVTRTATALVTVTQVVPTAAAVTGSKAGFSPASVAVAASGTVTWTMTDEEHDVIWDGAAPAGGNIPRITKGSSASRTFAAAGTYAYHCTRHGETGSVVVKTAQTGAPVLTSLSVSPSSGGVQVGGTLQLTATPRDQNGAAMSGLPAASFSTSNPAVATVSAAGVVTGVAAGTATITATVTSGGVAKTGSAAITVTTTAPPPSTSTATVTTPTIAFSPPLVTIQAGGSVTWRISGATHNVTFAGPGPTGGNVPDTSPGGSATRTFPTAGTYDYQCTRHNGMTGRVVVQ